MSPVAPPSIRRRSFGATPEGDADLYELRAGDIQAEITTFGGVVRALKIPDRDGALADVVLGFDSIDGYLGPHPYFGGIVGRFGNRIANGRFELDGREYRVTQNEGSHHLHGGARGFDRRLWHAVTRVDATGAALVLSRLSPEGEEGYPGDLDCSVTYTVTSENELRIHYAARTDKPTVVNLTHHSYFNLQGAGDVLQHRLQLDASKFLPVDEALIPTGERRDVLGSPFDLRDDPIIGERMRRGNDPQIEGSHGYDHNFILDGYSSQGSGAPRRVARLRDPRSGRIMEVFTTEPGLQVYAGGGLDGTLVGKGGQRYKRHAGLCLETQHFPDSPNRSDFPSVRLGPGEEFNSVTVHRFSVAKSTSR